MTGIILHHSIQTERFHRELLVGGGIMAPTLSLQQNPDPSLRSNSILETQCLPDGGSNLSQR